MNFSSIYYNIPFDKKQEKADLLKAMLDEYEVSEEKASADIDTFIQKLREADVLE